MKVHPDILQVIIIDKRRSDHTKEKVLLDQQNLEVALSVKLRVVQLDDKGNFNLHLSNICKSFDNQLNTMTKLKPHLNFKAKKTL